MEAKIKQGKPDTVLKKKLGPKYEEVMTTARKLGDEVTALAKDYNQEVIDAEISTLVEQRKAELHMTDIDDVDCGPSTSKGLHESHRHGKNKCRKKSDPALVDQSDIEMYERWKEQNIDSRIPDVSVPELLLMLEKIEKELRLEETQKELNQCRKQLAHPHKTTCDHIQHDLRALRSCLLTRNWDDMVLILFRLVSKEEPKVYISTVKTMCEIMVEYNPMIEELHLTEQFQELFEEVATIYKDIK